MNKLKFICIILCIVFFLFLFSIIFSVIYMNSYSILPHITINNIDVSNLTKDDAINLLQNYIETKTNNSIKINYEDYTSNIFYSGLDVNYDISSAVSTAYTIGRTGNIFENNYTILNLLLFGKNIDINTSLNDDAFDSYIIDISSNLPNKLIESNYYIDDKNLIISTGNTGLVVDSDKFKSELFNVLYNISSESSNLIIPVKTVDPQPINIDSIHSEIYKKAQNAYYEKEPFKVFPEIIGIDFDLNSAKSKLNKNPDQTEYKIKLQYTYPKITTKNLNIDIFPDLLASFSTRYDASNKDRSTNLNLAAEKINNTIILPNEEFSYNKIVGARSIAAGYKAVLP